MVRKALSHNTILLTSAPVGRFLEGHLDNDDGLLPGFAVEVVPDSDEVGGRVSWRAYQGTTGERTLIAILLENELVGMNCQQAISDGQKVRMYCPIPGDELLVRVSSGTTFTGTGTGISLEIGDKLILNNGGFFVASTGTPEREPFIVMEEIEDIDAHGGLVHVMYTGC